MQHARAGGQWQRLKAAIGLPQAQAEPSSSPSSDPKLAAALGEDGATSARGPASDRAASHLQFVRGVAETGSAVCGTASKSDVSSIMDFCTHHILRRRCANCGGQELCEHSKRRECCKVCRVVKSLPLSRVCDPPSRAGKARPANGIWDMALSPPWPSAARDVASLHPEIGVKRPSTQVSVDGHAPILIHWAMPWTHTSGKLRAYVSCCHHDFCRLYRPVHCFQSEEHCIAFLASWVIHGKSLADRKSNDVHRTSLPTQAQLEEILSAMPGCLS